MKIGIIGLGKMGLNMTTRLVKGGHEVAAFDLNQAAREAAAAQGAEAASSMADLVAKLPAPRAVWIMVPAGAITHKVIEQLAEMFAPGDTIIDGGNSYYRDSIEHAKWLAEKQINFVDVGTSGGIWGLAEGYSMMIGGEEKAVEALRPIFETLAPAVDKGWGRVGPHGSGHFVKMVHNGIEYGMMQSYAEGFDLLNHKTDFGLDLGQVAEIWQTGSVVRSWLLDLTVDILRDNPDLEGIAPWVPDSGEGRWTVIEAVDLAVPLPVITMALERRFASRKEDPYADKLLAALRNRFGGHDVKVGK